MTSTMNSRRLLSVSSRLGMAVVSEAGSGKNKVKCKLLVCGGGSGGCGVAAKFAPRLGSKRCVIVEPADTHYYQPMWTMVGGGMKTLEQSGRPMSSVLPKDATWIKDSVEKIVPNENLVITSNGTEIEYEYLVVALGISLNYSAIHGLKEALAMEGSGVCSNYSPKYVNRTFQAVKDFKKGNAIFTFPNTPIKCAGAPQKAAYISEDLFRKMGKRDKAKVKYNTSLPVIFGVKRYADRLWELCKNRNIEVGLRTELVEVRPNSREAVFRNLDMPSSELKVEQFEMLHVCPPMGPPAVLKNSPGISDAAGYLDVDKETLRHKTYGNIFGIGDCTNLPTSKTAAAVAGQLGVLQRNLTSVMNKGSPEAKYDGYTSCPLVTGLSKCILAEFDYNLQPKETFPWDQGDERFTSFIMKKDIMPLIYWQGLVKGYWNGPGVFRKLLSLGFRS